MTLAFHSYLSLRSHMLILIMVKIVFLSLFGYLCFTIMDFLIQFLLQSHSVFQISFFNALSSAVFVFIFAPLLLGKKVLNIVNWKLHLFRGILVAVMDLTAFYSFQDNSITTAYALILTGPLWSGVFDLVLAKQKKSFLMWLSTLFTFIGVVVVLNPGVEGNNLTILFALVSAIVDGFCIYVYRHWGGKETTISFVFSGATVSTLLLLPFSVYYASSYTVTDYGMNILSGAFFAIATLLVLHCFRKKEVLLIGSMQYSQIIWAMLINILMYQIWPVANEIIGNIMVVVGGILLIWSSRKKSTVLPTADTMG